MLKRRICTLAVTGITVVAAALATLGTTSASAATTTASASGHVTAPRAAADASGCVVETFTTADEHSYLACVADAQILFNDLWYWEQAHNFRYSYLGVPELLTVDGSYGPITASVVRAFQSHWSLSVDGRLGPQTWKRLCTEDYLHGYRGTYWRDAGCATEPGL